MGILRTRRGSWLPPILISWVLYIWNVSLELIAMECQGGWCCHCWFLCRSCTLGWSTKSRWICFSWRWAAASLDSSPGSSGSVWQRLWRSLRSLWCSRYVPGHGPQLNKTALCLALAGSNSVHTTTFKIVRWRLACSLLLFFSLIKSYNITVGKLICSQSNKAMEKKNLY